MAKPRNPLAAAFAAMIAAAIRARAQFSQASEGALDGSKRPPHRLRVPGRPGIGGQLRNTLHSYRTRYSHVLTAYSTEENLRRRANQRRAA